MSDPNVTPVIPEPPVTGRGLAIVGFSLGVASLIFAIIPGLSFIAWIPGVVALTLGIVALATKRRGRGLSTAAVVLGPIAFLLAAIVSIVNVVGSVRDDLALPDFTVARTSAPAPADEQPSPLAEMGTRTNPAPAGSTVELSDNSGPIWNITIGAATLNANDIVAAENQFNQAADAGTQYVLVPITFTYVGSQSGKPWPGVDISYVSAAGTTHEQEFIVIPNSITDIAELYEGATATGNLVVMAPTADVEKGTWAISALFGEKFFVAVV